MFVEINKLEANIVQRQGVGEGRKGWYLPLRHRIYMTSPCKHVQPCHESCGEIHPNAIEPV